MPRSQWFEEKKKLRLQKLKSWNPFRKRWSLFILLLLTVCVLSTLPLYLLARDLPAVDDLPDRLSYTSFIYNHDGSELIATLNSVEQRFQVSFETLPEHLKQAFIATEDERFYRHFGVDIRAIFRAISANISNRSMSQGGSTLTQQLAKNVYLTHDKTITRKVQEWILAVRIERVYPKDRILEMYLNQIFLGYNAYGVEAAAHHYFGKSAAQLTLAESAMLAGIAKAPNALSPRVDFNQAKARQSTVLNLMFKNEYISAAEVESAKMEDIQLSPIEKPRYQFPYFVDYVLREILATYGAEAVYRGGLSVFTTIDPLMQKEAEDAVAEILDGVFLPQGENLGPEVALISADPNTGYIKAMVGGRNHQHVLGLNRVQQPRQPGSAFKPLAVFAPAIANGYSPESVILDAPITLRVASRNWSPRNYDYRYLGPVTLREAAARSINTVAVRLIDAIGVSTAISFIQDLGITTLVLDNSVLTDTGPAIALGGLTKGVTPLELNSAYGVFATGGYLAEPIAILKVVDRSGKVLQETGPQLRSVLDPGVAYLVTDMLKDSITKSYGTAARYGIIGRPAAAKTGTSSDVRDAWFVGYTPDMVTTVWMGFDKTLTMESIYGGGYPAQLWNRVMVAGHSNLPIRDFPVPRNLVTVQLCSVSGKPPGPSCSSSYLIGGQFIAGKEPFDVCTACSAVGVTPGSSSGSDPKGPKPGDEVGKPYDPNQYYNPVIPRDDETPDGTNENPDGSE